MFCLSSTRLCECTRAFLLLQGRICQFPRNTPRPQNWQISTFPRQETPGLYPIRRWKGEGRFAQVFVGCHRSAKFVTEKSGIKHMLRVYLEEQNTKSGDIAPGTRQYHHSLSLSWQLRLTPLYPIMGVSSTRPTLLRALELDNASNRFLMYTHSKGVELYHAS